MPASTVNWFKRARLIHLYLGCLCTPLLLLFCATGALQIFGLRADDGSFWGKLAAVHMEQSFGRGHMSLPLKVLSFFMAWSVVISALLGVAMAFRLAPDRKKVWVSLAFGLFLPIILLAIELFKS